MLKIRKDNQFTWAWAITRDGQAIDLTTATNLKYKYQIKDQSGRVDILSYTKTGNIISTVFLPTQPGIYNLLLTFDLPADGPCAVDVDAFEIVKSSEDASDASEFTVTSEMAIGFTGKNAYEVWLDTHEGTLAEYEAWLKQPAADAASSVALIEEAIEQNEAIRLQSEVNRETVEGLRAEAEQDRISAEGLRLIAEYDRADAESIRAGSETARDTAEGLRVQAEQARQTNTATAIQNAETATTGANNAASLANEKAGLADQKATLADQKAGLADQKATLANDAATQANAARDGANSAAQSATNLVNSYATDLAAKELKANKQNSLTPDGTGTKFPTVDAVNAGLLLKENKQLIADYTHNSNIVLPKIASIDYSTSTITFTAPHEISSVPHFYSHTCVAQINDFTIKTNYKAVPSGLQVENFFRIAQIVSPTALRFSRTPDGSNYVLPCAEPTFVDFTKWHLQYIPPEANSFNVLFEPCVAVKVVVMARTQHGQPYFDIKGNETASENIAEIGTLLGIGNAIIERTYWISGNGLVTVRTSWTGNTIRSAGLAKVTYDTINTWRYENITFFNALRYLNYHPTFCNGTRFLIYKLA